MIEPGKRFDPAEHSEQNVINRIKKLYSAFPEVMDIEIDGERVRIVFRDATPEKYNEAMQKLHKGLDEARRGQIDNALNLFKEVLEVIPENLDARRNMAKAYLEMNDTEKAKKALQEFLQIDPTDHWAAITLGNIYASNENSLDMAAFYYDMCLKYHPDDAMLACKYAALMFEKGEYQKVEVLFQQSLKYGNIPNAYYGLALLYRTAGELDASKKVLETLFVRLPQQRVESEYASLYVEAKKLYSEVITAQGNSEKKH